MFCLVAPEKGFINTVIPQSSEVETYEKAILKPHWIAHEMRNYLDVIDAQVKSIPESRQLISLESASQCLRSLVDVLSISNPVSRSSYFDVTEVILEEVCIFECAAEKNGIKLSWDLPRENVMVYVDRNAIKRSLHNLIENAVEACREGDCVRISCTDDSQNVQIRIADTGMGMTEEQLEFLGKPMFTTKINGTGLGVYIANSVIARSGGSIQYESSIGKGATVLVTFPKN